MAGRQKKIIEETIDNKVEESTVKDTKASTFEEFMTPENMMKMFAMFKQMESMQQQTTEQEKVIKVEEKVGKSKRYEHYTKSMLMNIRDEMVNVRSVVDNVCFTSPMTKISYRWKEKGAIQLLPISEVLAMDNQSSRFLYTPWLVIEDERVIDALGLGRTYELVKKVEDVNQLIKLNKEEIKSIFDELPKNYKHNFKNEIFRKVATRELNDLKTIDILSEVLNINLKDVDLIETK